MIIPGFVSRGAFNWTKLGYHFHLSEDEKAQIFSEKATDPWLDLARIVEAAKIGDFSPAKNLIRYFQGDHQTNINPVALLVAGDIGRQEDLESLVDVMRRGPDGLRIYACQGARNAGSLWLVPHMLAAWRLCSGSDAHETIGFAIADMLDPIASLDDLGFIGAMAGHHEVDVGESLVSSDIGRLARRLSSESSAYSFARAVYQRYMELRDQCESEEDTVWAGKKSGVVEFSEHFLKMLSCGSFDITQAPLVVPLREKFEAMTGMDCTGFYREGRLVHGEVVHVLEKFLASSFGNEYQAGKRYFFSRRIA
ncbi:hypothetical protein [Sphaerotilus sp.]|uniref:hypothetical protein n=1 Tax=Sphaerotilus sp. TaxID=2093942 RepID=UPI002ACEBB6F|nr:hypothetical protein [Sphaerotilus sp.]MDZ7856483.1 hypothetical protein [Sphaerotilus sp.]